MDAKTVHKQPQVPFRRGGLSGGCVQKFNRFFISFLNLILFLQNSHILPLNLKVPCCFFAELKDAFEVVSVGKESYVFRASTSREYRRWLKYLRLESKDLGTWKRRRKGLPNIMLKNL